MENTSKKEKHFAACVHFLAHMRRTEDLLGLEETAANEDYFNRQALGQMARRNVNQREFVAKRHQATDSI